MGRGGQWATAHRIAKSLTRLSDLSTHAVQTGSAGGSERKEPACNAGDTGGMGLIPGWGRPLEEGPATRSSVLAWRSPRTEEPGGLQPMGRIVRLD